MQTSTTNSLQWRLPAEWEPQAFVQLTWPHADTDWRPMLAEITATYVSLAIEIARREPLLIVAPRPDEALQAIGSHADRATMDRISVFACPTNDTWARDHAFITLTNGHGARLLDFCFNGWGRKFAAELDNAINRRLFDNGAVGGQYSYQGDFVLEGGAIESDGRGTVLTTSGCLLAPCRNQPMSRHDIEQRLKQALCAERVVWIDHGQLTGDDTDGHIDTLVRMAPGDTLLYVGCDDTADEQCHELMLMEQQLRTLRTPQGSPYRLMRLPMPRPIVRDGERLPATYANFLVVNGAVLCPTYGQPDLDAQALHVIGQAFADREIVGVDCRSIVAQHGSLHCCTMQYPMEARLSL